MQTSVIYTDVLVFYANERLSYHVHKLPWMWFTHSRQQQQKNVNQSDDYVEKTKFWFITNNKTVFLFGTDCKKKKKLTIAWNFV